ncbi:HTH-type transcriptional regulator BhcR [Oceaniglobus trochenteri]|uniref:HTH-type transcriptional regulator BhcR n=1 Tax=Oceaniglobus trochenteri TaxID=2763260 RepID=UPI001CFF6A60|nr:HTH-type transcriptional regulator BhcR [Oceaniglobus trochenteri]
MPPDQPRRGRPRAFHDQTDQNIIKSLDRALVVLQALADQQSATLSHLAQSLDQSPATLYRVLLTLQQRGMVDLDEAAQTWHIGAGAFLIGASFLRRTALVDVARPVLRALMEATGETANLGVERGDQVLFVSQAETHETIRAFFPPGSLSPLHASGIGKALLATWPEDRLNRHLARRALERFTPHTITDAEALRDELRQCAARGYAVDGEEKNLGMRCIAAPVTNAMGDVVAGISVSGPTSRVDLAATGALATEVVRAAQALSAAMGARAEPAR